MSVDEFKKFLGMERELISAEELKSSVKKVLEENSKAVEDFKNGKESAIQFLLGQVMKETHGNVDPSVARELIIEALKS